jgi:hypothetical protein
MKILEHVAGMVLALACHVGGLRLFHRRVVARLLTAIRELDASSPASPLRRDTKDAGFVVSHRLAPVLKVDATTNVPQVGNCVVRWVAVDMVNVVFGPLAVDVQPSEAVEPVKVPVDSRPEVSAINGAADSGADLDAAVWLDKPSKYAGAGIVVKKLAQMLRGKIGLSHEALQLLIGQRPASVSALSGLRYFSREGA